MPISEDLKRVYSSAPTNINYVNTLMFTHSLFSKVWAIANFTREMRFQLENGLFETFLPIPFQFVLPANNTGGNQDLNFAICNVGREIMDEIEAAIALPSEPVKCIFRVYLDQPDTPPQNDAIELTVSQVNFSIDTVTANARRFDMLNYGFPNVFYETQHFPGLKR